MSPFVSGIELNRGFYADVVAPILAPWRHSAALIGYGSQVLGYDTERSIDHGWGPRLAVWVEEHAVEPARLAIDASLPDSHDDWPIRYGWDAYPVRHYVGVSTAHDWLRLHLGFDPREECSLVDWLATPQELLLEVVRGAVYHDALGELTRVREQLAYFPDDVWRWMLACQWQRVAQEEPFVGRTSEVGDETGSRVLTARLARMVMQLWFLYEREYWPYTKWFGHAFSRLSRADELQRHLDAALDASDYSARERALVSAYELVARQHNEAGITEPIDPAARQFYNRPFQVIGAERFVTAVMATVTDQQLRARPPVGSIDQLTDSTDILANPLVARRLRAMYEG
jgi:uncharacterized protein DUF4037